MCKFSGQSDFLSWKNDFKFLRINKITVGGQIIKLTVFLLIAKNLILLTIHILKLFHKNNMKDFKIITKNVQISNFS